MNKIILALTFILSMFSNTVQAADYEVYQFDCRLQNNDKIDIFLHSTEIPYLQIESTKYIYFGENSVQEFLFKHTSEDVIVSLQYVDASLSLMHFKNAKGLVTVLKCTRV
ncbi:hypothetical protein HI145_RS02065 [Escherichia coli]|nr:hypothetical protein [Escherichia coli]